MTHLLSNLNISIISMAVFLVYFAVWCIAMLRCIGYRRLAHKVREERLHATLPPVPVSIILTTQNQASLLTRRLTMFLEQQHPEFEVIVVDMNSCDESKDYLANSMLTYPNLHVCSLPTGTKDIDRTQLALTLGVRSARYDWVLFTDISCQPTSKRWLWEISSRCSAERQIVMGYTRYQKTKGWTGLRYRFFRTWQQTLNLTHALRYRAYRCAPTNLCYSKSFFLSHKGFAEATTLQSGFCDIIVNRHSSRQNTTVCLHPDSFMLQDCPGGSRFWNHDRLFFMETRRHLPHHVGYRLRYAGSVALTWIHTLTFLAAIGVIVYDNFPLTSLHGQLLTGALLLLWFTHLCWRTRCFHLTLRALDEPSMHLSLPLLLHLVTKWDLTAWLRHRHTNKNLFRKKFI